MTRFRWMILWLAAWALASAACAPVTALPEDAWTGMRQADGSVVWLGEYRFEPPPPPWQVIDLNDTDVSLAFHKLSATPGLSCESSMGYAEEPFGSSRELAQRAREFFRRHLWAARVKFAEPSLQATTIAGREGVIAVAEAREPVSGQKVLTKAIFVHRGERVVALFMNQWRGGDDAFDHAEFADFDRFVASFRFLKPSFYESL